MRPHFQQQASQAYAASAQLQFKFGATTFWPTALLIVAETAYTVSSPTAAQDWLARQIASATLFDGERTYWSSNFRDIRPWYWSTRSVTGGGYQMPDFVNGTATVHFAFLVPFHPYIRDEQGHLDLVGLEAAKNGKRMSGIKPSSTLELDLTLQAASSPMGTTGITQGTTSKFRPTLIGIEYGAGEQTPVFFPRFQTLSATPDQTYSGEGWKVKFPQGVFLEHTTAITLKGATASSGDVRDSGYGTASISEIAIKTSDDRKPLDMKAYDFNHLAQGGGMFNVADDNGDNKGGQASLTGGAAVVTDHANMGIYPFKWVRYADSTKIGVGKAVDPDFGLNLGVGRNVQDNALVLAETVDTTTNIVQALAHRAYGQY